MNTFIPGQPPSTPPHRPQQVTVANAPETTSTVQRSGGVVLYQLGKPAAKRPQPGVEPRILDENGDGVGRVSLPRLRALSPKQIRDLSALATKAFNHQVSQGVEREPDRGTKTVVLRAWRYAQTALATGSGETPSAITSLKAANQGHYNTLLQHFASLCPDPKEAARSFDAGMKLGKGEACRQMICHKIAEESNQRGLAYPHYVESICRQQYKCPLSGATPKQLWALYFTIRNRVSKDKISTTAPKKRPTAKNTPPAEVRVGQISTLTFPAPHNAEYDAPF